ncbi:MULTISPECIES: bifunctional phosphopantothenoylcysteine decarboxylase/phosphopantothenate--cysteine ligase CoaBC [Aneurinibacillus]|uniref:Coenzyme A biosynthesis bifunctional protein CoaBC n=1 Tax=Aneurinibacillus thermoaerophilus TaxID=143495 RepID=A0A1G7WAR6_ANETH|nr:MULTISPECIES: bifunctional phosphopantothenoylcysteine decarboxylase/phosphopantothenate--cysteine ligase CoaBC [Aneurinibacillus]AMA72608.1 phosphopantothenoylcysteine decarboxylase [Aneurinibacillus sp. XH2]MED0674682.1 bifunctional phosphopantothenoylcysteine decarboxylase/phosphopantothenate--cysteine ligase CoaBC [Aneurinibacillus thermoaerophilus]MED0680165.1 bifunctional phosphopantothenoylcysteine decarboxylase/phosphopantothenate--cysteine ligase CoaBC [Aneurinibacillus thermoaerophi
MKGKTIVIGVAGGIAIYKIADLCSKLTQKGADVWVLMTEAATKFVQPVTFQALVRNPVLTDIFQEPNPSVISHIDVADRADLFLIAPATANIIGKMANGIADDIVTTAYLATKAPVWIAPAMNVNMYNHPAVQHNIRRLAEYGYRFIEPAEGYLACGWIGKGRLAEPMDILQEMERFFAAVERQDMKDIRLLVTAGATREAVDPVRFFTNRSSGKMGYAIAEAAAKRGAKVTLVSGKTDLTPPAGVEFVEVTSAEDMYQAVISRYDDMDIVVKAAAVADYRPKVVHSQKMKKKSGDLVLELTRTRDILADLGKRKTHQFLVGFAAETENVEENARGKLERKNADMIVANNVTQSGAGFGVDTNIVTIYTRDGKSEALPQMRKTEIADCLLDKVLEARGGQKRQ